MVQSHFPLTQNAPLLLRHAKSLNFSYIQYLEKTLIFLFMLCNITNNVMLSLKQTVRQKYTNNIQNFSYIPNE